MLAVLLALLVASPLAGQATPSIAPHQPQFEGVTLREYVDVRLTSLREVIEANAAAQKEAINKAETSLNKRLEGVPETFVDKKEFTARADAVDGRLKSIENRLSSFDGSLKIGWLLFLIMNLALGAWLRRRIDKNGK